MTGAALIVEVPTADQVVASWRRQFDPVSRRGVPAHITVLVPFVAPADIDEQVIGRLSALAGQFRPIPFELTELAEFPDAVWLRPEPNETLIALTETVWSAFPDYPPYNGKWMTPDPHLTVAQSTAPQALVHMRRQLDTALRPLLPITCTAEGLSLFVSDADGRWTRSTVFAFDRE